MLLWAQGSQAAGPPPWWGPVSLGWASAHHGGRSDARVDPWTSGKYLPYPFIAGDPRARAYCSSDYPIA